VDSFLDALRQQMVNKRLLLLLLLLLTVVAVNVVLADPGVFQEYEKWHWHQNDY
jgi:hypothetical protein